MKHYLLMMILAVCALCCAGCAGNAEDSPEPDSAAETTASSAVTTTATEPTTTVTTATTVDYLVASDMKLTVKTDTVRPSKCTAELTNSGSAEGRPYTAEYRIYEVSGDAEKPCAELPDYEAPAQQGDVKWLAPEQTAEIPLDWGKRYGDLQDGTYILEITQENVPSDPDDPDSPKVRLVVRTEFEMDSSGFVPQFIVAEDDINPEGIVLTIKNSKDAARWYAMTYHLYDESRTPRVELLEEIDKDAQLHGNNYMPPGGELVLVYDWSKTYGSLVEGEYVLEIQLLADGEKEGKTYRIPFEVT